MISMEFIQIKTSLLVTIKTWISTIRMVLSFSPYMYAICLIYSNSGICLKPMTVWISVSLIDFAHLAFHCSSRLFKLCLVFLLLVHHESMFLVLTLEKMFTLFHFLPAIHSQVLTLRNFRPCKCFPLLDQLLLAHFHWTHLVLLPVTSRLVLREVHSIYRRQLSNCSFKTSWAWLG